MKALYFLILLFLFVSCMDSKNSSGNDSKVSHEGTRIISSLDTAELSFRLRSVLLSTTENTEINNEFTFLNMRYMLQVRGSVSNNQPREYYIGLSKSYPVTSDQIRFLERCEQTVLKVADNPDKYYVSSSLFVRSNDSDKPGVYHHAGEAYITVINDPAFIENGGNCICRLNIRN